MLAITQIEVNKDRDREIDNFKLKLTKPFLDSHPRIGKDGIRNEVAAVESIDLSRPRISAELERVEKRDGQLVL